MIPGFGQGSNHGQSESARGNCVGRGAVFSVFVSFDLKIFLLISVFFHLFFFLFIPAYLPIRVLHIQGLDGVIPEANI